MRRVFSVALLIAVAGGGVAACGSDDDAGSGTTDLATEASVEGATWTLTELNDEAPPDGVTATLVFDGSTVSGSSGCNTYSGGASFDKDVVSISDELASTMMACEGPVGEFEAAYLLMLADASVFAVDGTTLTLSDNDDNTLATFTSA